jgi:hypothetical protein
MAATLSDKQKLALIDTAVVSMLRDHDSQINSLVDGGDIDAREFQIKALKDLSGLAIMIQDLAKMINEFLIRDVDSRSGTG